MRPWPQNVPAIFYTAPLPGWPGSWDWSGAGLRNKDLLMKFADIPSLKPSRDYLTSLRHQKGLPHALLLTGLRGSGVLPLSLAFLRFLYCSDPREGEACQECGPCRKTRDFSFPTIHFFFPRPADPGMVKYWEHKKQWADFVLENPCGHPQAWGEFLETGSKNLLISKEDARFMIQTTKVEVYGDELKTLFIWCPEYLHPAASAALLKTLEEPSKNTFFLMVSHAPQEIMDTVKSRARQLHIPPFSRQNVSDVLALEYGIERERADQVASLSDGDFHQALEMAKHGEPKDFLVFEDWMRSCYASDVVELVGVCQIFSKWSRSQQRQFLGMGTEILRLALHSASLPDRIPLPQERLDFLLRFGKFLSFDQFDRLNLSMSESFAQLRHNANPSSVFMDLSLGICDILG